MVEVAERVLRTTGSRSQIVFRELPADDPKVRRPDIGLAEKVLGWSPKIAPDEGLNLTLPYFEAQVGSRSS